MTSERANDLRRLGVMGWNAFSNEMCASVLSNDSERDRCSKDCTVTHPMNSSGENLFIKLCPMPQN